MSLRPIAGLLFLIAFAGCHPALAETISLETALDQAAQQSYELKLAHIDTAISKAGVKEMRSGYYPQIHGQANTEYQVNLAGAAPQVAVVGNTLLPGGTRYQNAITLSMNYMLCDFGQRHSQLEAAKEDVAAKAVVFYQNLRDLKLKIIDTYTQAFLDYKSIQAKQQEMLIRQQLFDMKQRLRDAGTISKVEYSDEGTKLAKTVTEIRDLKIALTKSLNDLSAFTHVAYDADNIQMQPFQSEFPEEIVALRLKTTPEFKEYDFQIASKRAELESLESQNLPQISLYSTYIVYGFNQSNIYQSYRNLHERTYTIGVALNLPIFDGFKNAAQRDKTKLEIDRLKVQKQQALWDLQNKYNKADDALAYTKAQIEAKQKHLDESEDKLDMVNKLADQRMVDQTAALNQKLEVIEQQLELDTAKTERLAYLKKLHIIGQGKNADRTHLL